jgi:hypothetical protein
MTPGSSPQRTTRHHRREGQRGSRSRRRTGRAGSRRGRRPRSPRARPGAEDDALGRGGCPRHAVEDLGRAPGGRRRGPSRARGGQRVHGRVGEQHLQQELQVEVGRQVEPLGVPQRQLELDAVADQRVDEEVAAGRSRRQRVDGHRRSVAAARAVRREQAVVGVVERRPHVGPQVLGDRVLERSSVAPSVQQGQQPAAGEGVPPHDLVAGQRCTAASSIAAVGGGEPSCGVPSVTRYSVRSRMSSARPGWRRRRRTGRRPAAGW